MFSRLPGGQRERLGDWSPRFTSSGPPLAVLLIRAGILRGQRLTVRTPVANIGRANYNDLKLPDPSIGASHAKLQLREGVWTLADLGSSCGSLVDGERVTGELPLPPGATIRLGEVLLLFDPRDSRPPARPGVVPAAAATSPRRPAPPRQGRSARWIIGAVVVLGLLALSGLFLLG